MYIAGIGVKAYSRIRVLAVLDIRVASTGIFFG